MVNIEGNQTPAEGDDLEDETREEQVLPETSQDKTLPETSQSSRQSSPAYNGEAVHVWVTPNEIAVLERLREHYGYRTYPAVYRRAVLDVLVSLEDEAGTQGNTADTIETLTEQVRRLADQVEASNAKGGKKKPEEKKPEGGKKKPEEKKPENEEEEPEEEEAEEISLYDPEVIESFSSLSGYKKNFLSDYLLRGDPSARNGLAPAWQRRIIADVQKIAPYDGKRADLPDTRQARVVLHDFLVDQGILEAA